MAADRSRFYVTTPIYYPNAKPHLGHLYSTVLADVIARVQKLKGKEAFLLTGTEEHGQKIAQAAAAQQITPQALADKVSQEFRKVWDVYGIQYDHFVRTTDEYHKAGVTTWIKQLIAQGDIYKGLYTGWYCIPCETYVTEKEHDAQVETIPCTSCGRATTLLSEESYFFKLSAYQDRLLAWYKENSDFIVPRERAAEVIRFVEEGLKDLSLSRTTVSWGIPFPGDARHTVYVWADALNNYITAIGYGDPNREEEFKAWWPADVQVMGKDIIRFHAVYWPAFLMAAGLALPRTLLVHGFFKLGDQKMSKSLGNVIDPLSLAEVYGAEAIRFYVIRHMAITQDSPFSIPELETRLNADLANDLGNLINRTVALAHKQGLSTVRATRHLESPELALRDALRTMLAEFTQEIDEYYVHRAYAQVWKYIAQVNAYFHAQEPWKVVKTDAARFETIISAVCHSLYALAYVIEPVMPKKMQELRAILGAQEEAVTLEKLAVDPWMQTFTLTAAAPLFKKYESVHEAVSAPVEEKHMISIQDFSAIELRVGTIEQCEEVPKSDKLYKLSVNFGDAGVRQVLSGVKAFFAPDYLRGKQVLFVYNLQPRSLMGLESQGMLLTARDESGNCTVLQPACPVPNGTKLS